MMVALLILLVGTASAAVAVNATQAELRSAGRARLGQQGRYASEAAMMTSISYIDLTFRSGDWQQMWETWDAAAAPPEMHHYGEAEVDPVNRHHASRMTHKSQTVTQETYEYTPLSNPQAAGAGGASGAGAGGAGGAAGGGGAAPDPVGNLGPRSAYQFPLADADAGYTVDLTDCFRAPSAMVPGETTSSVQFYCSLTARARLAPPNPSPPNVFSLPGGDYLQEPFTTRFRSRATIITPPVLLQ